MQKWAALMGYEHDFLQMLLRFNIFQVLYAQYWFTCQIAADAPYNDLKFFKKLVQYAEVDPEVSAATVRTFRRHVHYLGPEFSFLSLASDKVSTEVKRLLAQTILAQPRPLNFIIRPPKMVCPLTVDTELQHLAAGEDVHLPFSLLDVDESFLRKDPDKWPADPEFKKLQLFINNFRVTNDCAKRACQLATVFNGKITKNEEQRQYLYSNVMRERHLRSSLSRKALE
jgi:hypothetical protein